MGGGTSGASSPGSADSERTTLGDIADRLRAAASERLGSDPAQTLRDLAAGRGDAAEAPVAAPPFDERPELYVGAAFAGGLVLAGVLRLLNR